MWASATHKSQRCLSRQLLSFHLILQCPFAKVNQGKSISTLADQKLKESILEKWVRSLLMWAEITSLTFFQCLLEVYCFNRYMLVDNEEDNKTHRPVAPKDVSLGFRSTCAMCPTVKCFFQKKIFFICFLIFWFWCFFLFFIQAPKKLVRYHGNQVVTTKGERYQLVKKDETEDMKKTYVNLKPARKYRFHWWQAQSCKSSYWRYCLHFYLFHWSWFITKPVDSVCV